MSAGTLSCPMCGAPVPSMDSSKCDHCGATLATVACPTCFAMIFQGAKFCSHCGASVHRTEVDPAASRSCPHCRIELVSVNVGRTNLRECSACGGIWVDKAILEQICADREQQSAVLGVVTAIPPTPASVTDLRVRYYPCPICKSFMNRVNFAKCSGVVVDVCRAHGTWFDKDELRRIVEFIRAGGFEKARAIEIEELKQQRQKLESAQAAAMSAPHDYNWGGEWSGSRYHLFDIGISAAADAITSFFTDS